MRCVTNEYEITDTYKTIFIDAKDASVKIEASNDDSTKPVCFADRNGGH